MGSVEQPIEGRAPFRSLRRRDDSAVGPNRRLKIRPRRAGVGGRRPRRWLKPTLASTARNAKRGYKRAHSCNPGKVQVDEELNLEPPSIGEIISGAGGENMAEPPIPRARPFPATQARRGCQR